MSDAFINIYTPGMTPKELAAKVLENSISGKTPSIPIDPFKLMREYGIVYQFREVFTARKNCFSMLHIRMRPVKQERITIM